VHQEIVSRLGRLLNAFIDASGGACEAYPEPFAVNLYAYDSAIVEPDISVVCDISKLSERGCEGAPDLVAEIVSKSTSGMDCVSKPNPYHSAGVREYWIADPLRERVYRYDFGPEVLLSGFSFTEMVASSVMKGFEVSLAQVIGGS
jgi:Uma2 family endonuclease